MTAQHSAKKEIRTLLTGDAATSGFALKVARELQKCKAKAPRLAKNSNCLR